MKEEEEEEGSEAEEEDNDIEETEEYEEEEDEETAGYPPQLEIVRAPEQQASRHSDPCSTCTDPSCSQLFIRMQLQVWITRICTHELQEIGRNFHCSFKQSFH
jgi:hypothetical protein